MQGDSCDTPEISHPPINPKASDRNDRNHPHKAKKYVAYNNPPGPEQYYGSSENQKITKNATKPHQVVERFANNR